MRREHELSHSFAYVQADVPPGMTLAEWWRRRARPASRRRRALRRVRRALR